MATLLVQDPGDGDEGAIKAKVDPATLPLTSWEATDQQVSMSAALKVGLPVVTVAGDLQTRVLVRDVRASHEVLEGDEFLVYGVSIRLVVTVSAHQLTAEMTSSLPVVSAHAQLNHVRADARLKVLGFSSLALLGLLPDFSALNVESYGSYTASSDAIKKYIAEHKESITPVLLERRPYKPDEPDLSSAVATTRALQAMADGESLKWVLGVLRDDEDAQAAARVVWTLLAPDISDDEGAPGYARERASEYLRY